MMLLLQWTSRSVLLLMMLLLLQVVLDLSQSFAAAGDPGLYQCVAVADGPALSYCFDDADCSGPVSVCCCC